MLVESNNLIVLGKLTKEHNFTWYKNNTASVQFFFIIVKFTCFGSFKMCPVHI